MSIKALSSSAPLSKPNRFKYSGKELQSEFDLGWYDYGARNYDAQIGRWNGVDPRADEYNQISPYTFVLNNPIRFLDPDGEVVRDADGNIVYVTDGTTFEAEHDSGLKATLEIGYIFADDGRAIKVYKNNRGGPEGFDTNCHGTSFCGGADIWLNNPEVPSLIEGDGYEQVNIGDIEEGDKAIYLGVANTADHSATVTKTAENPADTEVEGLGGVETKVHKDKITKAWSGRSNIAIFRKKAPDRVATTLEIEELLKTVFPDQTVFTHKVEEQVKEGGN